MSENLKSTSYYFDENLRDIPSYPEDLKKHIETLRLEISKKKSPLDQVRLMGEIGVYLRQLLQLNEAEFFLTQALRTIEEHQLGIKYLTQQKIRLAHVFQWKKEFNKSSKLFSEAVASCRNNNELQNLLPFTLQHYGKDLFDQKKFKEALLCFNEALEIRLRQNAPIDQIESTKLAIKVSLEKMNHINDHIVKREIPFEIRRAKPGDQESLAQIHIQSWQEAYKGLVPQDYLDSLPNELPSRIQNWTRNLANPERWAWVATIQDQIVGFILFGLPRDKEREDYIELGAIYLLESYKGQNIGFSLLQTGFHFMKSVGYKKSYCWVLMGNPTINFYEKTGAKHYGLTKEDDIGGKIFEELAYEWSSLSLNHGVVNDQT